MTHQEQVSPTLLWEQPDWQEEAHNWIHQELGRQGSGVSGPMEQFHVRPWSTVIRVPTGSGTVYFKAVHATLAHEATLTEALAAWQPDLMVPVLATDKARGWLLTADAGPMLRTMLESVDNLHHWRTIWPRYAELQIELASRRDELLALGALDGRVAGLPARYEQLLAEAGPLCQALPDGLSAAEVAALERRVPRVAELCALLAASGVPETLHHDDFHDGNVFVREGRYFLSDWGESYVTFPFFTLTVGLRSIAYRFELEEGSAELAALRDLYLEPWTHFAPRGRLLEACAVARRVGMICRAMTWYRIGSTLDEPHRSDHMGSVAGWLQMFLEAERATLDAPKGGGW